MFCFFDFLIYGHRRTVPFVSLSERPALLNLVPDLRPPEEETTSHTNLVPTAHTNFEFLFHFGVFTLYSKDLCYLDLLPLFKRLFIQIIKTCAFFIILCVWCMIIVFLFAFPCCFRCVLI